jgi:hypothetical protein
MNSLVKDTKASARYSRPQRRAFRAFTIIALPLVLGWVSGQRVLASGIEPPPGSGVPKSTIGGGSRPSRQACFDAPTSTAQLVALSPAQPLGLTKVDRPSFVIYLPPTQAKTLELSLFDHQHNGLYQTTLPIPKTSGWVSIPLPAAAPKLAKNRSYAWSIALICDAADRTEDWVVSGWIQRPDLPPQLRQHLATASAVDQVKLLAAQGFWHEAISTLMQLKQKNPTDPQLVSMWQELLRLTGLAVMN